MPEQIGLLKLWTIVTDLNFGNKQISLLATTVTTATPTITLMTALKEQHLGRNARVF